MVCRGELERLLFGTGGAADDWSGQSSPREELPDSGLWKIDHVGESHDPDHFANEGLIELEARNEVTTLIDNRIQ